MKAYNEVGVREQKRRVRTVKKAKKVYAKAEKELKRAEKNLDRAVDACVAKHRRHRHPEPERLIYR